MSGQKSRRCHQRRTGPWWGIWLERLPGAIPCSRVGKSQMCTCISLASWCFTALRSILSLHGSVFCYDTKQKLLWTAVLTNKHLLTENFCSSLKWNKGPGIMDLTCHFPKHQRAHDWHLHIRGLRAWVRSDTVQDFTELLYTDLDPSSLFLPFTDPHVTLVKWH